MDHLTETERRNGYQVGRGFVDVSPYRYWLRFVTRADVERFRAGFQPRLLTDRWYFRSENARAEFRHAMFHVVAFQQGTLPRT